MNLQQMNKCVYIYIYRILRWIFLRSFVNVWCLIELLTLLSSITWSGLIYFIFLSVAVTDLLRADTFLGDFFLSLGRERSCSKPLLSSSCLMAMLASCSMSLKVSLMLRKTEKTCSLQRVLTRTMSGSSSVAFFSSWVTSAQRITSLAETNRHTHSQTEEEWTLRSVCDPVAQKQS